MGVRVHEAQTRSERLIRAIERLTDRLDAIDPAVRGSAARDLTSDRPPMKAEG